MIYDKTKIKGLKYKEEQLKVSEEIIGIVKDYFQKEIIQEGRESLHTYPRQMAHALINNYCDKIVLQDIATITNLKTHATILNSIDKINFLSKHYFDVKTDWLLLNEEIESKIDLSKTAMSLNHRKTKIFNNIKLKLFKLKNDEFFDTIDLINNNIEHYTNG